MIPFAANATATKIANAFEWPGQPQKFSLSLGICIPIQYMVPRAHPSLRPKRHIDRFSRFCTANRRVSHYFTVGRYVFPQNGSSPSGIVTPRNTVPRAKPTHHLKRHLDRFSRFVWVPNAMLYNALSVGKKTPKIAVSLGISSPCRTRTELRPYKQHAQKFGKDRACHFGDILADRQTDRQSHTHTHTHTHTR